MTRYFDQWVDHVDGALHDTFKQRYFINSTFFKRNISATTAATNAATGAKHTYPKKTAEKNLNAKYQNNAAAAAAAAAAGDIKNSDIKNNHVQSVESQYQAAVDTPPTVFCCVGGEGPALTENVVITGEYHCALMVALAAQHGALIVALEHRYYGDSIPTPDLTTNSMRFCE